MEGIYTIASSSSSSLYGNIGCSIKELILSKFPLNYFKYTNVSTELAFHNLRRQFGSNSLKEITKRRMPYINIQPVYQVPDQDAFLQNVPLTKNLTDLQYGIDARYLFDIIKDFKYEYGLKFKLNRDRIEYEVRITVATLHQQLDLYKALSNQLTWEIPLYHTCALESVIPKTIINYIGKLCRMDISNNPDLIPVLLHHLNSISGYPITYKMRNASATDEYFMYYKHRLLIVFYDLSIEDGNKKNMVDDTYNITFKVSAEFNLPGMYVITPNPYTKITDVEIRDITPYVEGEGEVVDYIPLFTLSNLWNKYPKDKDGMTLYGTSIFYTEKEKDGKTDIVELTPLLEPEKQKVIRFYTGYSLKHDTLLKVYILKDSNELVENEDYIIDWNRFEIQILKSEYKATYRIIIYISATTFNEIEKEIKDLPNFDKDTLHDNTIDWTKEALENPTVILSNNDQPFDSEDEFFFEQDGVKYDVKNIFDTTNSTEELIDTYNKYYGSENIGANTVWTGIIGDRANFVLKDTYNQVDDDYEYFFETEEGIHYLVHFVSKDATIHRPSQYITVSLWDGILADDSMLLNAVEMDEENNYEYSMLDSTGKSYGIKNMVTYEAGKKYSVNTLISNIWENILNPSLLSQISLDDNNLSYEF